MFIYISFILSEIRPLTIRNYVSKSTCFFVRMPDVVMWCFLCFCFFINYKCTLHPFVTSSEQTARLHRTVAECEHCGWE